MLLLDPPAQLRLQMSRVAVTVKQALSAGDAYEAARAQPPSCRAQELGCGGLLAKPSSWVMAPYPTTQLCHCFWLKTCLEMRRQLGDGAFGPHVGDPGSVSLCPLRAWGLIGKG